VRRRNDGAHLTACKGIIEELEHVETDAFPAAFVPDVLQALAVREEGLSARERSLKARERHSKPKRRI
jgi:hypothetical protein